MTKIVDTFFGGSAKKAGKEAREGFEQGQELIREGVTQARGEATSLFDAASRNRNLGFQGALDVFGQTIPQQGQVFQQGNVGAQGALLAGLPQIQNAILGLPTDFSGFQPQQLQFDPSFAQQTLPQFQTTQQALNPTPAPNVGVDPSAFLGGGQFLGQGGGRFANRFRGF